MAQIFVVICMIIRNIPIIALLCFVCISTTVSSQNAIVDSLKHELRVHTQKDTVRVKILNHLVYYTYRNNASKALEYAELAEKLSDEINHPKGKARSIYMRGVAHIGQSNLDASIESLQEAIRLYDAINDQSGIAGCNNALGVVYNSKGEYELALQSYQKAMAADEALGIEKNMANYLYNVGNIYSNTGKYEESLKKYNDALEIYTKNDDQIGVLQCWNSIASIYSDQGNYPRALENYNNSLIVAEKSNDSAGIFQSYNNIGNIYERQENSEKALEFYEKALAIEQKNNNPIHIAAIKSNLAGYYIDKKEFDTAITYLKSIINLSKELGAPKQLAISYVNLGLAYLAKDELISAMSYYQEALDISLEYNSPLEQTEAYLGIAKVHYLQNSNKLALDNALKSLQIAKDLELIKNQKEAYQLIYKIYDSLGNTKKAFISYKNFKTLSDSLFNKKNIEKITQLEYEYKYERELESANRREMRLTKKVETTFNDFEKSQRNLLLGVIVFLLVTVVLGGIIFFLKLRNVKSKAQNIATEQKLLRSQMTPHFIFNSLSVLQGIILNEKEKKAVSYLTKFSKLLRITLENSRDKMVSLKQELRAVEDYITLQNIAASKPFIYTIKVDDKIDQELFRIPPMLIQPFIENAIEHGFTEEYEHKEINIDLNFSNNTLNCIIIDNGIGVDVQKANKKSYKKSLATTITSERLKILSKNSKNKGSISIIDRKKFAEQGTKITMSIPYELMN